MSLKRREIFEIHRLKDAGYSERKIAEKLGINRDTVHKYLINPCPEVKGNQSSSLFLKPYYWIIKKYLERDDKVSAVVIYQNLQPQGYQGGLTILRDYLREIRGERKEPQGYIRFETLPGEQCQIDWGDFGTLKYGKYERKVWCFVMILCHSRMIYLEFTHSCKLDVFIGCHIRAFDFFKGAAKEVVHDNLKTAVIEREGTLVRFNERYLDFLRELHVTPYACNKFQPHEKGKVEKGGIHYVRYNFWPLREFKDIYDLNYQAAKWRDEIANIRIHGTTSERPIDRFVKEHLLPFKKEMFDDREKTDAKVYRDCKVCFDCNYYSVPYWLVGNDVVIKADNKEVSIYLKEKLITSHARCWEKNMFIDTPGHIKKLLEKKKRAFYSKQQEYFLSIDPITETYLAELTKANLPIHKNISALMKLKDIYGINVLVSAIKTALEKNVLGFDYIENIIISQNIPKTIYSPVIMKQDKYNSLMITEADLLYYDNLIFKNKETEDKK